MFFAASQGRLSGRHAAVSMAATPPFPPLVYCSPICPKAQKAPANQHQLVGRGSPIWGFPAAQKCSEWQPQHPPEQGDGSPCVWEQHPPEGHPIHFAPLRLALMTYQAAASIMPPNTAARMISVIITASFQRVGLISPRRSRHIPQPDSGPSASPATPAQRQRYTRQRSREQRQRPGFPW